MAKDSELQQLRSLAARRHRAVGQKISRLKSKAGVELAGTEFDPRRPLTRVKRYNKKQLTRYIARLDAFADRRVQYVRGAGGRPISADSWKRYQAIQSKLAKRNEEVYQRFANIETPHGRTVAERVEGIRATHFKPGKSLAVNDPLQIKTRSPRSITSEASIKMLSDSLEKSLRGDIIAREVKRGRREFDQMMDSLGEEGLRKRVKALSPERFFVLWQFTDFASKLSLEYELIQKGLTKSFIDQSSRDENLAESHRFVDWAENLSLE